MASAANDPVLTFAQVELGGLRFGLSIDHVVQALPRPASLTQLPRSQGALDGVFNHRGQVVPVVDLRQWMANPSETRTVPPHLMVLGTQGRVVGVAVDAIRGLLRVRASRVQQVHRDDSDESFFHSVAQPEDGSELVSLLDPMRLMARAQAWAQGASGKVDASSGNVSQSAGFAGAPQSQACDHSNTMTAPQALLRLGTTVVAIPAVHVGEVLRALPVQRIFGRDTPLAGMVRWRHHDVPLLNAPVALGTAPPPAKAPPQLMAVLQENGRHLALPVNEVVGLRAFRQSELQAAADSGLEIGTPYSFTTRLDDGERVHLLDTDRLLSRFNLAGLSTHEQGLSRQPLAALPPPGDTQTDTIQREGHIVFDVGALWAAPLSALLEITPLPAHFQPQPPNARGVVDTLEWRGASLPVLDIRQHGPVGMDGHAGAKLVAVQANGMRAGLVVNDVVALLPAHVGMHTRLQMAGGEWMHLITVGEAGQRKSHRVMTVSELPFFASHTAQ